MNDSELSVRPEQASAHISNQLARMAIDICALSEVRKPGDVGKPGVVRPRKSLVLVLP